MGLAAMATPATVDAEGCWALKLIDDVAAAVMLKVPDVHENVAPSVESVAFTVTLSPVHALSMIIPENVTVLDDVDAVGAVFSVPPLQPLPWFNEYVYVIESPDSAVPA
jgi:hypothetical protein